MYLFGKKNNCGHNSSGIYQGFFFLKPIFELFLNLYLGKENISSFLSADTNGNSSLINDLPW